MPVELAIEEIFPDYAKGAGKVLQTVLGYKLMTLSAKRINLSAQFLFGRLAGSAKVKIGKANF